MTIEIPLLEPEDDFIGGILSSALLGAVIEYSYSDGRRYRLNFDTEHHVRFDELWRIDGPPTPARSGARN